MLAVDALQQAGIRITEQEMDALLLKVVSEMVPLPLLRNPRLELTEAEAAALERGGFSLEPIDSMEPDDPIMHTAAMYATLLATSLSVPEAARILGVETSRVRQQLIARTLYGIKDVGTWRLPRFQFNDDLTGLVPGIRRILPHLSRSLHPVAVYTWFTSSDPDLVSDENEEIALSPRDWLRSGRSPAPVAELAASLGVAP